MNNRKTRFKPEADTMALINTDSNGGEKGTLIPALVINESYEGCCLAVVSTYPLQKSNEFHIKVGDLYPMKAELVWRKDFDEDVVKIGFKFLE